ncbi:MAG: squalene/phytoene synthase family protein [Alphaproteobacteria bacterium]|nr:squalene/phytoene synthase family protein [Alphaproteobacteria bacterium]
MLSLGEMIRKSQPALFWCMRSLSKSKREAIYTLFAFCRHLDIIARSDMPFAEKREFLSAWREELDNIYDKKVPLTNIGRKIYKNCMRFNLPKEYWLEILNSAVLKTEYSWQSPRMKEFEQYIRGSAVIPFRLALMIIDSEHLKVGEELSKNLGMAVLLTYMLKDVKDDAKTGQLYIPTEILQEAGVEQVTPREIIEDKNFVHVREKLAYAVENGYVKSERLLAKMNYADTRVFRLIYNLGRSQFDIMKKRGWEIISPKPKINFAKRMNIFYHTVFK